MGLCPKILKLWQLKVQKIYKGSYGGSNVGRQLNAYQAVLPYNTIENI